jgi:MoxR-like ATPase
MDVLAHRLVLSYDAIADGITATEAVSQVLQAVALPQVAPRQRATGAFIAPAAAPPSATQPAQQYPGQPGSG